MALVGRRRRLLLALVLDGRVAVVTGASRGLGRGISLALAAAGATVYATGRTAVDETAQLAAGAAGRVIPIRCDHADDEATRAAFRHVEKSEGRLDLLVNNATAVPDLSFLFSDTPFWELPSKSWDDLMQVGLRSHFIASQCAAQLMIRRRSGLIVNISSSGAQTKIAIVPYGVGKAAIERLTVESAAELEPFGVAVISLWPPPSKTEGMLKSAGAETNTAAWSSTEFTGKVVAALTAEAPIARTGKTFRVRELAAELGVPDDAELS